MLNDQENETMSLDIGDGRQIKLLVEIVLPPTTAVGLL